MLGHDDAWAQWRSALSGERMHHAWLLAGQRGLGKMHFALAAARELVAEPGVPQPERHHPDILVLTHLPKDDKEERKRAEGKPFELNRNVKIDQVRAMQRRLATRPTLGSRRAIVIDPADDLEPPAQNALLKSLEEPPQGTFFLLVSHRSARLLPTIRSRCRTLRFAPLSDEKMAIFLAAQALEATNEVRAAATLAASGSPGIALEFIERDLGPVAALMQRIANAGDADFSLRGKLAGAIGARPDRERVLAMLDLARSTLAGKVGDTPRNALPSLVEAHTGLVRLAAQAPTYNFDPGLLVMEIGTLLAQSAGHRERADA